MATIQQIDANRLNAQKSTGPRSVQGQAASCFNAIKTGTDAKPQVIPGQAFHRGCDEFSRLQRRIDSTSRDYHRALKELQRLESESRQPEPTPDPASEASPQPMQIQQPTTELGSFRNFASEDAQNAASSPAVPSPASFTPSPHPLSPPKHPLAE